MKYIVVLLDDKEEIFTFPNTVDHDRFAECIEAIRFGSNHNWNRKLFKAVENGQIISAGFVNSSGECYGSSGTLDLKSRGSQDTALLKASYA